MSKSSRMNRKGSRKNRRQQGGYESSPAAFSGNSMSHVQQQSLQQGQQFAGFHSNQHGGSGCGAGPYPNAVSATSLLKGGKRNNRRSRRNRRQGGGSLLAGPYPGSVQDQTLLPQNLHESARIAPLDAAINEIQGLKDQEGGKRKNRKNSRKNRKNTRKNRKNTRRVYRKNRRGGAYNLADASPFNAPGLLLNSDMESKALSGMNSEWKLANDPKSFAPGYQT